MQRTYYTKTTVTKKGNISIKGLPFKPGQTVEVVVRTQEFTTARS